jgi:archaemetzincin
MPKSCNHSSLVVDPSAHALIAGYARPDEGKRIAATTTSGRVPNKSSKGKLQTRNSSQNLESVPSPFAFPAPLVLPEDDLANDPTWPAQSLRSWIQLKDRNEVTPDRRTLYVAAAPTPDSTISGFVDRWCEPCHPQEQASKIAQPKSSDVAEYLQAFYHGMTVKQFPQKLRFISWDDKITTKAPEFIGLATDDECVRIRTRACLDGAFERQLNLDDLLDACISMLPDDAYSLLLLVNHDMYESDDDLFCCGRAYGGSRVAVVSSARDNPTIAGDVDLEHAWPASHCSSFIQSFNSGKKKSKAAEQEHTTRSAEEADSPLRAAVSAHAALPSVAAFPSLQTLSGLWFGRVCFTASHELGHCFGLDHCVYYACAMQGGSSIAEGTRQPPYFCPVDLAKVLRATGASGTDRYRALLQFCERRVDVHIFSAYAAWIRRLLETETTN